MFASELFIEISPSLSKATQQLPLPINRHSYCREETIHIKWVQCDCLFSKTQSTKDKISILEIWIILNSKSQTIHFSCLWVTDMPVKKTNLHSTQGVIFRESTHHFPSLQPQAPDGGANDGGQHSGSPRRGSCALINVSCHGPHKQICPPLISQVICLQLVCAKERYRANFANKGAVQVVHFFALTS